MRIKFNGYANGFCIASYANEEDSKNKLLKENLNVIFVENEKIVLLPSGYVLSNDLNFVEEVKQYNNYDVFEIWENGTLVRRYNDKSDDNYFFVTGSCNSNCVMCPSPEVSRKNIPAINMADLMELARHIPSDAPHLTITGGEPFLVGEDIYPFIKYLKNKFENTEFLFLTNGRIFSVKKYLNLFKETIPYNSIVAIPIHGSCEEIHDYITSSENSFKQTVHGIRQLLKNNIRVEIRVVISKLNMNDFGNIVDLIINKFNGIAYVSIIAMEMTGNARKNMDILWVPYRETFECISNGITKLVKNEIDVKLYNFPLCTVDKKFWPLCEKSISTNKVRFKETCNECLYKTSCGGVFAGTFQLEKEELKAIL